MNSITSKQTEDCRKFVSRKRMEILGCKMTELTKNTLPHILTKTIREVTVEEMSNAFLKYDSINDSNYKLEGRLLIFCSKFQQRIAKESREAFADGTYYSCPKGFQCLYTIHCLIETISYPVVFVLMPNEKKETFKFVLNTIKDVFPNLDVVHTDCQLSVYNSFKEVFKGSIRLVLFHLDQALRRNIKTNGLSEVYKNDINMYTWFRRLMALPFLPVDKIIPTFELYFLNYALSETFGVRQENKKQFENVINYYHQFWILKIEPMNWSVFDISDRTDNRSEGYHNALNCGISYAHPNLSVLIDILRRIENKTYGIFNENRRADQVVNTKRKKNIDFSKSIQLLTEKYKKSEFNGIEYFGEISMKYIKFNIDQKMVRTTNIFNRISYETNLYISVENSIKKQNEEFENELNNELTTEFEYSTILETSKEDIVSLIMKQNETKHKEEELEPEEELNFIEEDESPIRQRKTHGKLKVIGSESKKKECCKSKKSKRRGSKYVKEIAVERKKLLKKCLKAEYFII